MPFSFEPVIQAQSVTINTLG